MDRDGTETCRVAYGNRTIEAGSKLKVLLIDNYDSFVYNLAQCVGETTNNVVVKRNDQLTIDDVRRMKPDRIIISPGPGMPANQRYFGICTSIIRSFAGQIPILGV